MSYPTKNKLFHVYTTSTNFWDPRDNCWFFPQEHDWDHSMLALEATSLRQIENRFQCKVYKIWKENRIFFHRKTNCYYEIHVLDRGVAFERKKKEKLEQKREYNRLYQERRRYQKKIQKLLREN